MFSNEKIDIKKYYESLGNVNILISTGTTEVEDVGILSKMDYIVGPPSTFNGWASFIGNKKRFWMNPEKMNPCSLEEFKIHFIEE